MKSVFAASLLFAAASGAIEVSEASERANERALAFSELFFASPAAELLSAAVSAQLASSSSSSSGSGRALIGSVPATWILKEDNIFSTDAFCTVPDDTTFGFNMAYCTSTGTSTAPSSMNRQCWSQGGFIKALFYTYDGVADCSNTPINYLNSTAVSTTACGSGAFGATCSTLPEPWLNGYSGAMKQYFKDASCGTSASVKDIKHFTIINDGCYPTDTYARIGTFCDTSKNAEYLRFFKQEYCNGAPGTVKARALTECQTDTGEDDLLDDGQGEFAGTCCVSDAAACRVPAPPSSDDDSSCFSADSAVTLADGSIKSMAEVQVGDRVMVVTAAGLVDFSEIVFVPHAENSVKAQFVHISTAAASLHVTASHLVTAGVCGSIKGDVRAEDVSVGHCVVAADALGGLREAEVTAVSTSEGRGVYSAVARDTNGHLVVDGLVASSFGVNHAIPNSFYSVHRLLYDVVGNMFSGAQVVQANAAIGELAVHAIASA